MRDTAVKCEEFIHRWYAMVGPADPKPAIFAGHCICGEVKLSGVKKAFAMVLEQKDLRLPGEKE